MGLASLSGVVGPAHANVVWNWSAGGGAHQGQFITDGTSLAPQSFTILDAGFSASTFMPLGSVSGGPYHMPIAAYATTPPYTIVWDGSAVVSIDAAANTGVNGLIIGDDESGLTALFGTDSYGSHVPGDWEFTSAEFTFERGSDLILVPEPPPMPEIAVQNSVAADIADGGAQSFGGVLVGADTTLTFTILNTGTADLTGLSVTSDAPAEFAITSQPAATIGAPSGATSFTVQFTPAAGGARSSALHIASNDLDENPFDIQLTGTGGVNCVVGPWSDWGECCHGSQERSRSVVTPAVGVGTACPPLTESRACATPKPVAALTWPVAGSAYPVNLNLLFIATFTDSGTSSHTGTWWVDGVPASATIVEPDSGNAGSATVSHTFTTLGSHVVRVVVASACGGIDSTNATIHVGTAPAFPQAPVLDDFNRANGTPANGSHPWVREGAHFVISANQLSTPVADWMFWNPVFGSNQECYVTFTNAPLPGYLYLYNKQQGTSWEAGGVFARLDPANAKVVIDTYDGATFVVRGEATLSMVAGDVFGLRTDATGVSRVYRNGNVVLTANCSAYAHSTGSGRIGIAWEGANVTTFRADAFGGGSIDLTSLLDRPVTADLGSLSLSAAYPNPTHGGVTLSLTLPAEGDVAFGVLDLQGREVWSDAPRHVGAGRMSLTWDGSTARGPASPGVYLARVRAGGQMMLRRLVLIR